MASPDQERAPQVCGTCKARKKGCDKRLPICSYCAKRNLLCRYDAPGSTKVSGTSTWKGSENGTWANSPSPIPLLTQAGPFSGHWEFDLDRILDSQLGFILRSTGVTVHEICRRYFEGVHKWLPVVCDTLIEETVARAQSAPAAADFSLLILAMYLISLPEIPTVPENRVTTEALYMSVKMLFGQVQAIIPASIHMVQTGIIISAFEYACGRPDAAYISMGTCVKMADSIGLDKCNPPLDKDYQSKLKAIETWNMWWGIVILERIILVEALDRNHQPSTIYPGPDAHLPLDLTPGQPLPLDIEPFDTPTLSTINSTGVSSFGRQAQAVYLHNEVTRATRLPDGDESKLRELKGLDDSVQSFLTFVMEAHTWEEVTYCGVVASSIRSLFLLHQSILSVVDASPTELTEAHLAQSSRAALDTASKMMVDIARSHRENLISADLLPICCTYNLRVARRHIEGRSGRNGSEDSDGDISALLAQERIFHERWSCLRHDGD